MRALSDSAALDWKDKNNYRTAKFSKIYFSVGVYVCMSYIRESHRLIEKQAKGKASAEQKAPQRKSRRHHRLRSKSRKQSWKTRRNVQTRHHFRRISTAIINWIEIIFDNSFEIYRQCVKASDWYYTSKCKICTKRKAIGKSGARTTDIPTAKWWAKWKQRFTRNKRKVCEQNARVCVCIGMETARETQ